MIIRKVKKEEIPLLAAIWLDVSTTAHHFISPHYWAENHAQMVENYLPNSEVYVAEIEQEVHGFIALVNDYLSALFVVNEQQGKGIGRALLEFAKTNHPELFLRVYQKNEKSVQFYIANGFQIVAETKDAATNENEFEMHWRKCLTKGEMNCKMEEKKL